MLVVNSSFAVIYVPKQLLHSFMPKIFFCFLTLDIFTQSYKFCYAFFFLGVKVGIDLFTAKRAGHVACHFSAEMPFGK